MADRSGRYGPDQWGFSMGEGKRADYERGIELGRAKVASAGLDAALAGEAVNSYALALERAYLLRDSWDRLGQPALARGSKGQPVPHPLITAIEAAERHLAAADAALTRRRVERRGNTTGNRRSASPRSPTAPRSTEAQVTA